MLMLKTSLTASSLDFTGAFARNIPLIEKGFLKGGKLFTQTC